MSSTPSQVSVVALAVYLLEGHLHPVDTEDVAIKANELAPGRFAWRKYPEQINLELVRVYLSAAKRPQYGRLISGSGRDGWTLTPGGLTWAQDAGDKMLSRRLSRERSERSGGSVDEARWQRERSRLVSTPAWAKWVSGNAAEISDRDAETVFRIDSYAVGRTRDLKVARVEELFSRDPEIGPFLKVMRERVIAPREEDLGEVPN